MKLDILFLSLLVILFFSSQFIFPQIKEIQRIPTQYLDVKESATISISETEWLCFYTNTNHDSLFTIRTKDGGINWLQPELIQIIEINYPLWQQRLNLIAFKSDLNIIVAWSLTNDSIFVKLSSNNGFNWGETFDIPAGDIFPRSAASAQNLNIFKSPKNTLYLCFNGLRQKELWFRISMDNGYTWSSELTLVYASVNNISDLNIYTTNDTNLVAYFLVSDGQEKIMKSLSNDGGTTWTEPETAIFFDESIKKFKLVLDPNNKIWLIYQKEKSFYAPTSWGSDLYSTNDLYYRISSDMGISWQVENQLTKYVGDDNYFNTTINNDNFLVSFSSQRFNNYYNPTFIIPGKYEELQTPPYIVNSLISPSDSFKNKFIFKSFVYDNEGVSKVNFSLGNGLLEGELFDDGLHNDNLPGDSIFANIFDTPRLDNYTAYSMQTNKLKLPMNNRGVLADVTDREQKLAVHFECFDIENFFISKNESIQFSTFNSGGEFDERIFLFSSGFFLSGLDNDSIWVNAVASTNLVEDYLPGEVGSDPKDPKNSLYVVRSIDKPFGSSWQIWGDAVDIGAEFYDGNKDGKYDPKDLNFNGIWDNNEDMPLLLGDETVWCVYNDSQPDTLRRWQAKIKYIEVAQTIFASGKVGLENAIFVRYKIINKSNRDYDSVYFGFWADPDLGDATDDLVGCDTLLNSGMVYNDGTDDSYAYYGENPPAFYTTLLQGPILETSLSKDTAYNKLGHLLGLRYFPYSINQPIYAHIFYIGGDPYVSDPNLQYQVRNSLFGRTKYGEYPDPCTFPYGQVFGGVDCSQINPKYWLSGDPVNQLGWLDIIPSDKRNLLSTGPFNLKSNEPVDIIAAYVVGRGTDALNSITVTREIVEGVIEEYKKNFPNLTYNPGVTTNPVISYELYQNYPNPFNPTTTIRYALPQDGIVKIKIFDILGQEVATLKNEFQKANRYEVKFNSKGFASGMYIYKLQVNDYSESKKMMLLK